MPSLRFKIDENIPIDAVSLLVDAGYDCHSVYDEHLAGAPDQQISSVCVDEGRVLITLDLDFSDVRTYRPGTHAGIVVLRPALPDRDATLALLKRTLALLAIEPLEGHLWIVDTDRVRVRSPAASPP